MLIATATVLHRVYTFDQTLAVTVWFGIALTGLLAAFSVYHCFTDQLFAHSALFGESCFHTSVIGSLTLLTNAGIMICAVGIQTRSIISARIPNPSVRKDVKKLATWGAVVFISGFGIWNLDNALCGFWTETKRALGMPWSFLFELHGWWHIFTGVGAYICLFPFPAYFSMSNAVHGC
jgi:dihydroceramidase